jgi:hypothetical protein
MRWRRCAGYSFDLNRLKTRSISLRSNPRAIRSSNAAATTPIDAESNGVPFRHFATADSNASPTTSDSGRFRASRLHLHAAVRRRPDACLWALLSSVGDRRSFELGRLADRPRHVLRTWSMCSGVLD